MKIRGLTDNLFITAGAAGMDGSLLQKEGIQHNTLTHVQHMHPRCLSTHLRLFEGHDGGAGRVVEVGPLAFTCACVVVCVGHLCVRGVCA